MRFFYKLIIFLILSLSVDTASAQSYPKYKTSTIKDTVFAKQEEGAEIISSDKVNFDALPEDFKALFKKASQEYREKKYSEAVKTWTEAFKLCPNNFKYFVLQMRAYSYFGQREYNKAIQDCTTGIDKAQLPHENAKGGLMFLRALCYKSRNEPGDDERACADYINARKTGFISGDTMFGYEECK